MMNAVEIQVATLEPAWGSAPSHVFWMSAWVLAGTLLVALYASPARAEHEPFEEGFEYETGRQVAAHIGAVLSYGFFHHHHGHHYCAHLGHGHGHGRRHHAYHRVRHDHFRHLAHHRKNREYADEGVAHRVRPRHDRRDDIPRGRGRS